ncbi:MAG: DUF3801 domain-containing protein [Firmicutes bacterium]|nr:DUF3801 domain-containing protein [Bacillota bacterium]
MALDEQGKGFARSVLKFIGNRFTNFFKLTASDIRTIVDAKSNRGKLSVNRLLKQNFDKTDTPNMNEELTKSLCKELKKYNLAYAIEPQGENEKTKEIEYKIIYNKKDAPVISNAIENVEKKMLKSKNQPKKSLHNLLNRKMPQKVGLSRSEPIKHKEVGAR